MQKGEKWRSIFQQAFQKEKVKIVSKREKSLQQKWIETVTNLYACSILATLIKWITHFVSPNRDILWIFYHLKISKLYSWSRWQVASTFERAIFGTCHTLWVKHQLMICIIEIIQNDSFYRWFGALTWAMKGSERIQWQKAICCGSLKPFKIVHIRLKL